MELKNFANTETATKRSPHKLNRLGLGLMFVICIMIYTALGLEITDSQGIMLVLAAMIGGYMAMNIGANDAANNVGPAVGSRAISMTGAIVIAAIFEMGGALIAGGDVLSTIRSGIINPEAIPDGNRYIWLMTAALLAGALWLNFANAVGAPVSTTHSIVGALLGAGIAAGGMNAANWSMLGGIAVSWIFSPILGGAIAAGFLFWIKRTITYKSDMISAAQRTVPILIGLMAFAFATYLTLKGVNKIWKVDVGSASLLGAVIGILTYFLMTRHIARRTPSLENTKASINTLFTAPLICAAAVLSFAHGANDVANAVGPLAAIADAITHSQIGENAVTPLWMMMVGALGIAIGLSLYGQKLIHTVGSEITELDQMRAFCIAMSAAVTVIFASQLGLPVSSTHIALGSVFGVGFLREFIKTNFSKMLDEIKEHHPDEDKEAVDAFLHRFHKAGIDEKQEMLKQFKAHTAHADRSKRERKQIRKVYRNELVKRTAVFKIAAAWIVTVPASAIIAAMIYFMIFGLVHA